jgi:carbonic anhydrase
MRKSSALWWLVVTVFLWQGGPAWASDPSVTITPGEAIHRLEEGNSRFCHDHCLHPREDAKRRAQTAADGQHPFAMVLSCCDSRVPVEIVFDQGIGDIFAIRVAGNVCGTDEMGSIEYAEEHLGSPLLVVLGHTECGAVTAATVGAEVHGNVKPVIDRIAPAVRQAHIAHPELSGKALVPCAIEANVWQGVEDLLKKSPATRHRVEAGKLKVVGAIYDVKDGQVKWLGEHPQQSQLLKNAH